MSQPNPSHIECEECGEAPDSLSDKLGMRKLCVNHRFYERAMQIYEEIPKPIPINRPFTKGAPLKRRPMSTTELLQAILQPATPGELPEMVIEAEAKWFSRDEEGFEGEAQATVRIGQSRYVASLEKLP